MRFVIGLMCALTNVCVAADERYYPTVDAQGHVLVIKSEPSTTTNTTKSKQKDIVAPTVVESHSKIKDSPNSANSKSIEGARQLDSETYIDAELLEKKHFNIDDKKRFYYLPDGGIGTKIIESTEEVAVSRPVLKAVEKPVSFVSSNYLVLSKEEVLQHFSQQTECIAQKIIKKNSKPFKSVNNIWVQPPLKANTLEIDALLRLVKDVSGSTQIRIASFGSSHTNLSFYLPIVVFLDSKGCVLSGAWQYWSRAYAATDTQYASVEGLLNVPNSTVYVLFYRPNNTLKADIPLSLESGSFVVEAY